MGERRDAGVDFIVVGGVLEEGEEALGLLRVSLHGSRPRGPLREPEVGD